MFKHVRGHEHSTFHKEKKDGFCNGQGTLNFNISSISGIKDYFDFLENRFTGQRIFEALFNQRDDVRSTSFEQCLVHGSNETSSCMQSLCEIFVTTEVSMGASIPQWALKSKIIMKII